MKKNGRKVNKYPADYHALVYGRLVLDLVHFLRVIQKGNTSTLVLLFRF